MRDEYAPIILTLLCLMLFIVVVVLVVSMNHPIPTVQNAPIQSPTASGYDIVNKISQNLVIETNTTTANQANYFTQTFTCSSVSTSITGNSTIVNCVNVAASGGGIAEFAYSAIAIIIFTVIVVAAYLVARKRMKTQHQGKT